MKKVLKQLMKNEQGHVLPMVLVLLLIGSLMVTPLLSNMGSGIKAVIGHEENMSEYYTADAGVEDGIHKIANDYAPLLGLDVDDSYSYNLSETLNGLSGNVTITKVALIKGVVDSYNESAPHEGWLTLDTPVIIDVTADYVEYSVHVSANYTGGGSRRVEQLGVYFTRQPENGIQIDAPHDMQFTGILTSGVLEPSSPVYNSYLGGFAFIWDWKKNNEPAFSSSDPVGALDFKFRVHDPDWQARAYFAWFMVREQDTAYIASGTLTKLLIQASAGDTVVTSLVFKLPTGLDVLTWEITS